MGLTIRIGNAVLDRPDPSEDMTERFIGVTVEKRTDANAPNLPGDDETGQSNERCPSAIQWATVCEEVGLVELLETGFYATDGTDSCGGVKLLTREDLELVRIAKDRWMREANGGRILGWEESDEIMHKSDETKYDGVGARLVWIEWWMAWALANCNTPALMVR